MSILLYHVDLLNHVRVISFLVNKIEVIMARVIRVTIHWISVMYHWAFPAISLNYPVRWGLLAPIIQLRKLRLSLDEVSNSSKSTQPAGAQPGFRRSVDKLRILFLYFIEADTVGCSPILLFLLDTTVGDIFWCPLK